MILLIDLDGTLLDNPMDTFLPAYLQALAARMAVYSEPQRMIRTLLEATHYMIEHASPDYRLEENFDAAFFPALGLERGAVQPVIDAFYAQDFPALQRLTRPQPEAVRLVEEALQRGYRLGIATNPLFPLTAITQRLEWAGLPVERYPFELVPSYATFHFAKPNPAYYAEFLGCLGWPEEPAVMVGNDAQADIAGARQLGLPVYWVNGVQAWNGPGDAPPHGGLAELLPWLESVPAEALQPDMASPAAMLAVLQSTPAVLDTLCAGQTPETLARRPRPGEWSPAEVLCHLRDVEREVNLPRLCKVVQENNPFIAGRDTDPWAEARRYIDQDARQAYQAFLQARLEQLAVLKALEPEDWERPARHAIFGPTRLREMVNISAAHDRVHVRQVFKALQAAA
jgi:FMN phosphatase YigB (HAD superfamily)